MADRFEERLNVDGDDDAFGDSLGDSDATGDTEFGKLESYDKKVLLIHEYRCHKALWQMTHPLYYQRADRNAAWVEIASTLGNSGTFLRLV